MPPVPAAATAARLLARDVVAQQISDEDAAAAELAVSEMVTAALARMPVGPGNPPLLVAIHVDDGRVRVEVAGARSAGDTRSEEAAQYGVQLLTSAADAIEMLTDEAAAVRRVEFGRRPKE
ncbi:hypothetical protein ACFY05_41865 [Microtetraspora fusca]|uniref:YbaB/EbfC family nucleoid-associated protein n=1 Tax=Microtetraspora fusca TaxID=1997 RepID=A0ABW6VJ46_MICFU